MNFHDIHGKGRLPAITSELNVVSKYDYIIVRNRKPAGLM